MVARPSASTIDAEVLAVGLAGDHHVDDQVDELSRFRIRVAGDAGLGVGQRLLAAKSSTMSSTLMTRLASPAIATP